MEGKMLTGSSSTELQSWVQECDDMASSPVAVRVHEPLRIERLITPQELQAHLNAVGVRCGIIDLDGQWIAGHQHAFRRLVSSTFKGESLCEGCVREHVPSLGNADEPVILHCRGISEAIAPIRVRGEIVGYIRSAQALRAPLSEQQVREAFKTCPALVASNGQGKIEERAEKIEVRPEEDLRRVARDLQHAATLLAQECWTVRQMQILNAATRSLAEATTRTDVGRIALDAIEGIVSKVVICIYLFQKHGRLYLFDSRREDQNTVHFTHDLDQGHAGWAALHQEAILMLDSVEWDDREPRFLWPNPNQHPRSALTVPIIGQQGHTQAVIQVFSTTTTKAFQRSDIEPLELIGTSLLLALRRLEPDDRGLPARPDFEGKILELVNRPAGSGAELVKMRQELYQELTHESLKVVPGAVRASIRTYDDRARELRFKATAGHGWTEEMRKQVYSIDEENSAGAYAFNLGSAFFIEDTKDEKHFREITSGIGTLYLIPLYVRRTIHALLTVSAETKDVFTEPRMTALRRIAAQACGVLEHLVLMEESWLYDFEQSFSARMSVDDLCQSSMESIKRLFGARGCSIFLRYPLTKTLTLVASTALGETKPETRTYEIGEGLTGWVAKHGKILRIRDTSDKRELKGLANDLEWINKWAEHINYEDVQGPCAYLAAPLMVRSQLIGVLRLTVKGDGSEFQHSDEVLIERVADRLAVWIDNLWLAESNQRRLRQLDLSVRLGNKLTGTLDLRKVCEIILEEGCSITGCNAGHIRMFNKAERNLRLINAIGPHQDTLRQVRGIGEGMSGRAIHHRKGIFIPDVSADSRCRQVLEEDGRSKLGQTALAQVKSAVYFPLIVQREVIGTLTMHSLNPVSFGDEERAVFTDLAHRSAMALKAALMYQEIENELRAKIEALARVREIGIRFSQTRELDELFEHILDSTLQESRVEAGIIRILDWTNRKWVLRTARDDDAQNQGRLCSKLTKELDFHDDDFLGKAYHSPSATYLPDTKGDDDFRAFIASAGLGSHRAFLENVRSILVVPIRLQERCLGIIALLSKRQQVLLPATQEYLEALAGYAAVAIENARFHEEREKTRQFEQLAMLGALVGGFLHEIRNVAHRLSTALEVVRDPELDPADVPSYLSKMAEEIRRLSVVCTDLTVFARRDQSITFEPVDVNKMIRKILSQSSGVPSGGIKLIEELEQPAPIVKGNPVQLQQAVARLIENAIDAMPQGGILRIQSRKTGTRVEIIVQDSGIGMDENVRSQIFRPFFTTKSGGTGLGLSVVFGIVTHHSGTVDVESGLGRGTTFRFSLPTEELARHA
jgi:signal transduction histidine kinase